MISGINSSLSIQSDSGQTQNDLKIEVDLYMLNDASDTDQAWNQLITDLTSYGYIDSEDDLNSVVIHDDDGTPMSLYDYCIKYDLDNSAEILSEHGCGPMNPVDPVDPVNPENPNQQVIDDLDSLNEIDPETNPEEYDAAWEQLMYDIGGEENINTYTIEEDGNTYSLFGYAVTHDEPNTAQAFLDHPATLNDDGTAQLDGFDVNTISMVDSQGKTTSSMTLAILESETDPAFSDIAIQMMNTEGANLSYPFFEAVDLAKKPPFGEGDYYALDFMLANQPEGSDLVNIQQGGNNQTALEQAIRIDDTKLVATLIVAGADTSGTDTSGNSYVTLAEHTYYLDPDNIQYDENGVPIPSQGDPTMIGLLNGTIDPNKYLSGLES